MRIFICSGLSGDVTRTLPAIMEGLHPSGVTDHVCKCMTLLDVLLLCDTCLDPVREDDKRACITISEAAVLADDQADVSMCSCGLVYQWFRLPS